jgi:hypothetical protein
MLTPRPTLLALALLIPGIHPAPAAAQDITGTWRIASSETLDGASYGGSVTFRRNGDDCYTVDWVLDSGEQYSGVGLVARGVALAVAYRAGPAEGYGVVFYARKKNGGFEGWWCQPDGKSGVENLSGDVLTGTHTLTAGSSTGTVQISPYGSANYQLAWRTSSGNYNGFATGLGEENGMLVGVWGNLEGTGAVLYSLVDLEKGEMPGWWAPSVSEGQGRETLAR